MGFRCEICKVDIPCKHQIDNLREMGWNGDQDRADFYSQFLHDGDFEKWQPVCYMDHQSKEYQKLAIEAQREYQRALWILNRFTVYNSPEWNRLCNKIHENWKVLGHMVLRLDREDKYFKQVGEIRY